MLTYRKRGAGKLETAHYILSIAKNGPNGCILSPYPPFDYQRLPYSRIRVEGQLILVHRFIYSQMRGDIPEGMLVMHRCDNATCINPKHLTIGTHGDNIRDRDRKGRANRAVGARNFNTKLIPSDIPKIIKAVRSGRSMSNIGKEFGVSATAVCSIFNGKTWKHVPR
jgi:hypothetical protein